MTEGIGVLEALRRPRAVARRALGAIASSEDRPEGQAALAERRTPTFRRQ